MRPLNVRIQNIYALENRLACDFFHFPKKRSLIQRWCNLIKRHNGRDGFVVTSNTVICEQHFPASDIFKRPGGSRSRLRDGKSLYKLIQLSCSCFT